MARREPKDGQGELVDGVLVGMIQGYRYELDPTNVQRTFFGRCCWFRRMVYRFCVGEMEFAEAHGLPVPYWHEMGKRYRAKRAELHPWSAGLPADIINCACRDFGDGWSRYKSGQNERPSFPERRDGGHFGIPGGWMKPELDADGKVKLRVPVLGGRRRQMGLVRSKEAMRLDLGVITQSTISESATGRWYVAFQVTRDRPLPNHGCRAPIIGIDLGLHTFAVIAYGIDGRIEEVHAPMPLLAAQEQLKALQRSQRRQRGSWDNEHQCHRPEGCSQRWIRRNGQVKRLHERVAAKRRDELEKFTTDLVGRAEVIVIEDLNVSGMMHNHCLAGRVMDAGMGTWRTRLEAKCRWHGTRLVVIDRFYPSTQTCHRCGHRRRGTDKLTLSERTFTCPACGLVMPRDHNSAREIVYEGLRTMGGTPMRRAEVPGTDAVTREPAPPAVIEAAGGGN